MAYRGGFPLAPPPAEDVRLPAAIVGAGALAYAILVLVQSAIPGDWYYELYKRGSRLPQVLFWIGTLFRVVAAGGAVFFAVRTRSTLPRVLAIAGAVFVVLLVGIHLWETFVSYSPVRDTTRPSWATTKYLVRPSTQLRSLLHPLASVALAWAIARRDARGAPSVALVFALGAIYGSMMNALEFPWAQSYSPDGNIVDTSRLVERMFYLFAPFAVAVAWLARGREEPMSPAAQRPEARAWLDAPGVLAAAATTALVLGLFALANGAMMAMRGERDFDHWTSSSGTLRLEQVWTMVALFHGAVLAGGSLVAANLVRARSFVLAGLLGCATFGTALVSLTMFLRGRLKIPISSTFRWENLQIVWALGVVAMLVLVVLAVLQTRARMRAAATHLPDLTLLLRAGGDAIAWPAVVALGAAAVAVFALVVGEWTRRTATHEVMAYGGAAVAAVALAFASATFVTHTKNRRLFLEALRRAAS